MHSVLSVVLFQLNFFIKIFFIVLLSSITFYPCNKNFLSINDCFCAVPSFDRKKRVELERHIVEPNIKRV